MFNRVFAVLLGFLFFAVDLPSASSQIVNVEYQAVGGYSTGRDKAIFYSMHQDDSMQKPSVGFDGIRRFSTSGGDIGLAAVQFRVAVNREGSRAIEPQLYNAYFRAKTPAAYFWLGHNRPAIGLASEWDTHAQLLQPLSMYGFGFDRDWGVGLGRDMEWGAVVFSWTTGSGMPLLLKGNELASARVSGGVLNRDNFTAGLSLTEGQTLSTMGYRLMDEFPRRYSTIGMDAAYLWDNFEQRLEFVNGEKNGHETWAFFWRMGVNLLEENRLKLELQPVYIKEGRERWKEWGVGGTYLINSDFTVRAMHAYNDLLRDRRTVLQLYYYSKI